MVDPLSLDPPLMEVIVMVKKQFIGNLLFIFGILLFAATDTSKGAWEIEGVDTPKYFTNCYQRAIVVDANNHPHIVYGGDHLYYAYYNGSDWVYQTVDDNAGVGEYASIAIDRSGRAHISYHGEESGLKYATNSSGTWMTTTVDSGDYGVYTGDYASIAVDASGKVHISYYSYEFLSGGLKYATNVTGTWVKTFVDDRYGLYRGMDEGEYTSIAVDAAGNAHISYFDATGVNGGLKYATNSSGTWVITLVDSRGGTHPNEELGWYTSIALDSSGKAHISYGDYPGDRTKYATNASGTWVKTDVVEDYVGETSIALDPSGKVYIGYCRIYPEYATNATGTWATTIVDNSSSAISPSIAVDTSNKVHFSYDSNSDLKYATNASGTWITTTVDSRGDVGAYSSIALDSAGKAHISYYDETRGNLKYATNATGTWITTTVDSGENVGAYSSIALDSADKAHISYYGYQGNRGYLKYATNATGTWITTTVDDSKGFSGKYSSIALDSSGMAHISYYYYNGTRGKLKYATNASGTWVKTIVDKGFCLHTSLALDSSDKAHISYYYYDDDDDVTRVKLKYATNTSGTWVTSTVDRKRGVGRYTSLALDSSDKAHISYYDETRGRLKYATKASGKWVKTIVDEDEDAALGLYASLALDSSDKAHISYYYRSGTRGYLKYATNDSGTWVTSIIDRGSRWDSGARTDGKVGKYSSIALDYSGKAHISYYDEYNGYLKYTANIL